MRETEWICSVDTEQSKINHMILTLIPKAILVTVTQTMTLFVLLAVAAKFMLKNTYLINY